MSGLKEKIAKAISEHILLDDTYTYELTRVKSAFEFGTMSLDDFEEWSEENVDDLAKAVVDALQPQLNDNQQIVVNDVKQDHENYGIPKFNAIHLAFTTYATGYYRDHLKNDEEFYQVLSTLIDWALEQEEAG